MALLTLRRLRRVLLIGGLAAVAATLRNRKIEENQQRYNLP